MVPRQLCLLSRFSAVQSPTALVRVPSSTAFQLLCPANSHSRPLTTSGYGEISGPRILCLVSRQNRQRNRLLWWATHIVLQGCGKVAHPNEVIVSLIFSRRKKKFKRLTFSQSYYADIRALIRRGNIAFKRNCDYVEK